MDQQITLLFLTVALNALITGVIVSYFNKRLESRLSKQSYEHQVRFSTTFPKSLEVVATYNQKFHEYWDKFFDYSDNLSVEAEEGDSLSDDAATKLENEISEIMNNLNKYLLANLIYLPTNSDIELTEIHETLQSLEYLRVYFRFPADMPNKKKADEIAISSFQEAGIGIVKVDPEDKVALSKFTTKIEDKLKILGRRLDKHYKEMVSRGN